MNPDHLVCGLAASLTDWQPAQFTRFLAWFDGGRGGEPRPPLRADHATLTITSRGARPGGIGECLMFASVPPGATPGGLLVLAELAQEFAPGILAAMRNRGEWMAMSVRGVTHGYGPGRDDDLWVGEVSLVSRIGQQADPGALVIDTGPGAAAAWELLTGSQPALARQG